MATAHCSFSNRSVAFISLLLCVCSFSQFIIQTESLECIIRRYEHMVVTVIRGDIGEKHLILDVSYKGARCRSQGWLKKSVKDAGFTLDISGIDSAASEKNDSIAQVCCVVLSETDPLIYDSPLPPCDGADPGFVSYEDVDHNPNIIDQRKVVRCEMMLRSK